jgi:hypothetical protein
MNGLKIKTNNNHAKKHSVGMKKANSIWDLKYLVRKEVDRANAAGSASVFGYAKGL